MPTIPNKTNGELQRRGENLAALLELAAPIPDAWEMETRQYSGDMICEPCESYEVLIASWRKAMTWTPGLDNALTVMLACATSTQSIGDQLWIKVIGPAACGKSTLCEALSVNPRYIYPVSTLRGFHSGYKTDGEGEEDNSLIAKLPGKTLIVKDGDSLLTAPNKDQILGEARDAYDTTSRVSYRNNINRNYSGLRWTWILCGTSSLRAIDSSELGERFLDVVIMEEIDDELEDAIGWDVVNRTARTLSIQANGDATSHQDPEMTAVKQLTGGYVDYLRDNAEKLLAGVTFPRKALRRCERLGKFVAYMRARPSDRQDESQERECMFRLVSQLARLAGCLAVVLNKKEVDDAVMRRVTRVAFDTARGQVYNVVKILQDAGDEGREAARISATINLPNEKGGRLLRFMRGIGILEFYHPASLGR